VVSPAIASSRRDVMKMRPVVLFEPTMFRAPFT
jgi:hypothetical protein